MFVLHFTFVFSIVSVCRGNAEYKSGCQMQNRYNHKYTDTLYPINNETLKHSKIHFNGTDLTNLEMNISIKAKSDGMILFSPVSQPTKKTSVYEIVIGGHSNEKFFFRTKIGSSNLINKPIRLLNASNFVDFYVKISKDQLLVGQINSSEPLANYTNENVKSIKYFDFTTWNKINATFRYDCPTAETNAKKITYETAMFSFSLQGLIYIISACCIVVVVVVIVIIAVIIIRRKRCILENMDPTDINYENLPQHNEGSMPVPSQWTEVSAPRNDSDTYSVPYVTTPLTKYKTKHSELIYAELQFNQDHDSSKAKEIPITKPVVSASKPVVAKKPAVLTHQMRENNYVSIVKKKPSIPKESRDGGRHDYVNCNSPTNNLKFFDTEEYVNVSKDDCIEPISTFLRDPKESRDGGRHDYVNCNSPTNNLNFFDTEEYVNVSKDDCIEPTYCEVNCKE